MKFVVSKLLHGCRAIVTSRLQSCAPVTIERHLLLQELTLRPSGEWTPRHYEWFMVRVAEGVGYWLQPGAVARQLSAGDGLLASSSSTSTACSRSRNGINSKWPPTRPRTGALGLEYHRWRCGSAQSGQGHL